MLCFTCQKATLLREIKEITKMEKRKTILLGINDDTIITANVCITDRNGYNEFTASFNVGEAFNVYERFDEDYRKKYFNERWD